MNILGKTMIFKNNVGLYSIGISHKKQDGSYENAYMQVQMPKNSNIENKTIIDITNGFLSCYTNKKDEKVIKIVVLEYNILDNMSNDIIDDSELLF